ncbi:MAG: sigma-70 family RNA polymerase sigma factor [Halofilum sp. (in: g-proteobacteria)]
MQEPDNQESGQTGESRRLFEREVERLMDRLYGTALRLTRCPDDAEDVVAEAVGRAWSRLGELRDPQQFEGWLFRILHNTFISAWRRRRCRQDREVELDLNDAESDAGAFSLFAQLHQPFLLWWGTPEDRVVEALLREDIQRAVDALPDSFRVLVMLVEVEGYTYREAADSLGLPLGTVRSRLSRARSTLQRALWEQAREAGIVQGAPASTPGAGGTQE